MTTSATSESLHKDQRICIDGQHVAYLALEMGHICVSNHLRKRRNDGSSRTKRSEKHEVRYTVIYMSIYSNNIYICVLFA